ncbi:hypothetical protein RKD49_006686 [Streptomyces glaucescens]
MNRAAAIEESARVETPSRSREGVVDCPPSSVSLYGYRADALTGAGAYPVGRAVKVPRPWVRPRNRVA